MRGGIFLTFLKMMLHRDGNVDWNIFSMDLISINKLDWLLKKLLEITIVFSDCEHIFFSDKIPD